MRRAIGILLYEMLFGETPFGDPAQDQLATFKNIIQVLRHMNRLVTAAACPDVTDAARAGTVVFP